MKLFTHKDRHIVVAPDYDDQQTYEQIQVTWVDFAPGVEGVSRRGRPPVYRGKLAPVSYSELVPFDDATDAQMEKATTLSQKYGADDEDATPPVATPERDDESIHASQDDDDDDMVYSSDDIDDEIVTDDEADM